MGGERGGRADGGNGRSEPTPEELQQFLEIRHHVRRLQGGTPVLLRTVGPRNQEDLQICICKVSEDLQTLHLAEQEDAGNVQQVPIIDIMDVQEDSHTNAAAANDDEDSHYGLALVLRPGSSRSMGTMELICPGYEDFVSLRAGLRFLCSASALQGAAPPSPTPSSPPSAKRGVAAARTSPSGGSIGRESSSQEQPSRTEAMLRQRLQEQEAKTAAAQQENQRLRETVKQKDAVIEELSKKVQSAAADAERFNKTASTSRESDRHLLEREAAILRHKNKELRKSLTAKEQTVNDLLQMVSRLNAQVALESSAAEDNDSEEDAAPETVSPTSSQPRRGVRGGGGAAAAAAASAASAAHATVAAAHCSQRELGDVDEEREIEELASKLAMLESAVAGINLPAAALSSFQPPPRTNVPAPATAAKANPALNARAQGALQAARSLSAEDRLPAPGAATSPARSGGAATAGLGPRSIAALEALARQMAVLDAKKRVVEDLAKNLNPPSEDEDEDDGFPLR